MKFDYQHLIDRMITSFRLREKVTPGVDFSSVFHDTGFSSPYITISRDPGSGGRPIAKILEERLGWEYYNERLLDEMAKSTKIQKRVLQQVSEKGRTMLQDFAQALLNPDYVSDVKYMKELIKIILTLGYNGEVIILDHGANFILPEGHGLRVRITAPYHVRLQRAREYETKTELQARETLRSVEKDRREFVQQYFEKDIEDDDNYDLVINTSFYSMEDVADIIERALYRKFPNYRKKRRFLMGRT